MAVLEYFLVMDLLSEFRSGEIVYHFLKNIKRDPRLDIVGPIKAIQTVGSHHPCLMPDYLVGVGVDDIAVETVDNFFDLPDQDVGIFEFVVLALLVEVEELVADISWGVLVYETFIEYC